MVQLIYLIIEKAIQANIIYYSTPQQYSYIIDNINLLYFYNKF